MVSSQILFTFQRLKVWVIQTQRICLLCNTNDESRVNIFFNFPYPKTILLYLAETLNHSFWKLSNIPMPTLNSPDVKVEDLTQVCQKFMHHSHPWAVRKEQKAQATHLGSIIFILYLYFVIRAIPCQILMKKINFTKKIY